MRFLEAYSWPSAVFVDELDPGGFEGRNGLDRLRLHIGHRLR
jgi:hypothetical protein